jgi:hypothetical protein
MANPAPNLPEPEMSDEEREFWELALAGLVLKSATTYRYCPAGGVVYINLV